MASKAINVSTSGDNTIVAAVAGKSVRVHRYELSSAGAVNVKWKDGASTDLTGLLDLAAAGSGTDAQDNSSSRADDGLFQTSKGNALVLNLSAAVVVGGFVDYDLI